MTSSCETSFWGFETLPIGNFIENPNTYYGVASFSRFDRDQYVTFRRAQEGRTGEIVINKRSSPKRNFVIKIPQRVKLNFISTFSLPISSYVVISYNLCWFKFVWRWIPGGPSFTCGGVGPRKTRSRKWLSSELLNRPLIDPDLHKKLCWTLKFPKRVLNRDPTSISPRRVNAHAVTFSRVLIMLRRTR